MDESRGPRKRAPRGGTHNGPTPAEIQQFLNMGLSQTQIAKMTNVSRQAIHEKVIKYNLTRNPRRIHLEEYFPWEMSTEVGQQSPARAIRDHLDYMRAQGEGMSDEQLRRLRKFYRELREQNVVLEYDPRIPPQPGFANKGGFAYRKRRKSDRGLIIRVNDHTKQITEEGRELWYFPQQDP